MMNISVLYTLSHIRPVRSRACTCSSRSDSIPPPCCRNSTSSLQMFMVHVKQDLKAILGPKTPATTPENYGWMGFNIQKSLAIIEPFYLLVRPHFLFDSRARNEPSWSFKFYIRGESLFVVVKLREGSFPALIPTHHILLRGRGLYSECVPSHTCSSGTGSSSPER